MPSPNSVSLLKPKELEQLLAWSQGLDRELPDLGIHDLFARQVEQRPEATALVGDDETLTYQQLDELSGRIAAQLGQAGLIRDSVVGVCLPRSPRQIAVLLGILKAGGAYLALDLKLPLPRLRKMLDLARPVFVFAEGVSNHDLATQLGSCLLIPDWQHPLATRPPPTGFSHALAYVSFTSGSTGVPKGVAVEHRGVVRLVHQPDYVELTPASRVSHFAPLAFDASTFEIWGPLLNGGVCVLIPEESLALHELEARIRRDQVETVWLTAGLFNTIVDERPDLLRGLRQVLTGGEALSPAHVRRARRVLGPQARLINGYGPTECTTFATCHDITGADLEHDAPLPIGRPLVQTLALVLDESGRLTPPGIEGELYLGGAGVARGYCGDATLTAESFVPDPTGIAREGRLYRTGDRVRWRHDGRLEFLGRADQQLKIRGHRVELGEIESALQAQPGVATAVVTVDPGGQQRLIAHVVPQSGSSLDPRALLKAVQGELPSYMVPHVIVLTTELPLTANGKVDRRTLAARAVALPAATGRPPQSSLEQSLARIWTELLGRTEIDCDSSFFELGGHSLLAVRLAARVRADLRVELPIRTIFEASTIAALAAWIAERQAASSPEVFRPPLRPEPRPDQLPLSAAQQRMWFLEQFEGPSSTYHIPLAHRLRGSLDLDALRLALRDLFGRHESLRTLVPTAAGVPWQQILPLEALELPLAIESVSAAELPTRLSHAANLPFQLDRDLPLRVRVFTLGPAEHVLLLVLHHIAGDGTSLAPLWHDLAVAYAARRAGAPPAWRPLAVQYADYTLWQQRWLGSADEPHSVLSRELAFWKHALAGIPEELPLPTDRPRPREATYRGGTVSCDIPPALHARLQTLAREQGASLFMALQATLAVLLSRLGAGTDIPLGSPIAGRLDEQLHDQIGFYVNTLVLRTDLAGQPSFRELLRRVREFDLSAYAHQELPFEQLVHALQPNRSLARHPLFQVMLILQNTGTVTQQLAGLELSPEPLPHSTSKFDLLLSLEELPAGGLHGLLEYSADLYDPATATQLVQRFLRTLEQLTAQPDQPVDSVDLLEPADRRQLLAWSRGPAPAVPPVTAATLFDEQARRDPGRIALEFADQALTYGELRDQADRLARQLVAAGVGPEQVVGLSVDRSPQMVVAMLAIWKAGGAWLPLDPRLPPARLRTLVADSGLALALVDHDHAPQWQTPGLQVLDLRTSHYAAAPASQPFPSDDPHRLAYILYTSGSTGRPKGVEITHGALTNLLLAMRDQPGCCPDDAVLAITTFTFDISILELFLPLVCGARLVLAEADAVFDPARLSQLINRHRVTLAQATPATWRMLLQADWRSAHPLKALCGGEALSADLADDLAPRVAELWNVYGPTETTIWSTVARVGSTADTTSIGRPIHNTRVYILDERRRLVPPGQVGELWIAGHGVARGYRGQPDLTAQRFTDDPFTPTPDGPRMYATGDLAKWQPDGTLTCLGRIDHQVKIRGFRIELGEIETLLRSQPDVAGAVVTLSTDGQQRLVAHVIPQPRTTPEPATLRDALRQQLPDYMVPQAVLLCDAFPLTSSGKIDRRALAAREVAFPAATGRPPQTPLEQSLAQIWAELLGRTEIDCDTSFFDLGGHSLLAVRLFSLIAQKHGRQLPLKVLFEAPTIADLARLLSAENRSVGEALLTRIAPGGNRWPLYLLPSASGDILLWRHLVGQLDPQQPLVGLSPQRDATGRLKYESLAAWVAPMRAALELDQPTGPIHLLGYSAGGHAAHELARQLEAHGRTVAYVGIIDTGPANRPWNLGDRLRHLPEFLGNLSAWVIDNDHAMSWRNLKRRVQKTRSRLLRHASLSPERATEPPEEAAAWVHFVRMLETYEPGRLAARLHLIRARSQSPWDPVDHDLGWNAYCGGVEVTVVKGVDHQRIMESESLPIVAAAIRHALDSCPSKPQASPTHSPTPLAPTPNRG